MGLEPNLGRNEGLTLKNPQEKVHVRPESSLPGVLGSFSNFLPCASNRIASAYEGSWRVWIRSGANLIEALTSPKDGLVPARLSKTPTLPTIG
jgi:hypothetical protein